MRATIDGVVVGAYEYDYAFNGQSGTSRVIMVQERRDAFPVKVKFRDASEFLDATAVCGLGTRVRWEVEPGSKMNEASFINALDGEQLRAAG